MFRSQSRQSKPADESLRQTIHNLRFAIFRDRKQARAASAALDEAVDEAEVELLTDASELHRRKIARQTVWTRVAMISSAALVSGLLFASITVLAWVGMGSQSERMLVPVEALVIGVMLSALFGAMAGTLSLMVEIRATMERLRRGLDHGRAILFVESNYDLERLLERQGAAETGTVV